MISLEIKISQYVFMKCKRKCKVCFMAICLDYKELGYISTNVLVAVNSACLVANYSRHFRKGVLGDATSTICEVLLNS